MAAPVDPWLDQGTSLGNFDQAYFEDITKTAEEFQEPVPDEPVEPKQVEPVEPVALEPVVPVEPTPAPEPEPRITKFDDGSSLAIEQTNKGWKAVLDPNITGVNPEVFYGKTKDELYTRIAAGKVNATKKIRELNKTVKLGTTNPATPQRPSNSRASIRDLTADEIMEIKLLQDTNPAAAYDLYNEKRYGLKPADFARKLNAGEIARQLGDIESVARTFAQGNPDYYTTRNNFYTLIRYLVRKHFGRGLAPDEDMDQLTIDLLENGVWTVENLENAKEDLLASELLEVAPSPKPQPTAVKPVVESAAPVVAAPAPQPVPAAPPVATAPIAPQPQVRTRAGNLGIRLKETLPQPIEETPHSAENVDWNSVTDDVLEESLRAYRQQKNKQR